MPAIDWYVATLNFLKDNKTIILLLTTLLGIGGNIYQASSPANDYKAEQICEKTCIKTCNALLQKHINEFH